LLGVCPLLLAASTVRATDKQELLDAVLEAYESRPPYTMRAEVQGVVLEDIEPGPWSSMVLRYEIHCDGQRFDAACTRFDQTDGVTRPTWETRDIWTGEQFLHRQRDLSGERVTASVSRDVTRNRRVMHNMWVGGFLDGLLVGDTKHVARLLKESPSTHLADQMQDVAGYACFVLDAKLPSGTYKLWVDPSCGFNIRKATVHKTAGDVLDGKPLPIQFGLSGRTLSEVQLVVEDVEIARLEDHYFPVSGALISTWVCGAKGRSRTRITSRRSNIRFGPDFKKLGAFVMDKIPNGTLVIDDDDKESKTFYRWWNGRPITADELPPHIGDRAPAFETVTVDGRPLRLADYLGKYVLLDFWATWCRPCIQEHPYLKATYDAFGQDDRFVMISLSLDTEPAAPKEYAEKNGLKWIQGFLGDRSKTPVPGQFGAWGIPQILLIGPDGRILAKNLRGEEIKKAVARALGPAEKPR
jgi:peroxiredoxin